MLEIRPNKLIKTVCINHFNHKDVRKKIKQQLNFYLRLLNSYNPLKRRKKFFPWKESFEIVDF